MPTILAYTCADDTSCSHNLLLAIKYHLGSAIFAYAGGWWFFICIMLKKNRKLLNQYKHIMIVHLLINIIHRDINWILQCCKKRKKTQVSKLKVCIVRISYWHVEFLNVANNKFNKLSSLAWIQSSIFGIFHDLLHGCRNSYNNW